VTVVASVQVSPLLDTETETAGEEVRADMSMVRRDTSTRVERENGGGQHISDICDTFKACHEARRPVYESLDRRPAP